MSGGNKSERKGNYYKRLVKLLKEYNKVLLVSADNIGSYHLQKIRQLLRKDAVILMGKNTMIRKAMREIQPEHPQIESLIPHVYGNIGLVFIKPESDIGATRKLLTSYKIEAFAKNGAVAPCDVIVPKGDTGMDPGKTNFFQALSIQTKISKGKIEISNDVSLLKKGDKVTASGAALLQMLGIKPFIYRLDTLQAYDNGAIFSPALLDTSDEDILAKFSAGISRVAAVSLSIGYPTVASLPHEVSNGYRNLLAISVASNYTFKGSEEIKKLLSDPEALKAAQAKAAAPAAGDAPKTAATTDKKADKKAEKSEEEEVGGMGGLFGDDDGF